MNNIPTTGKLFATNQVSPDTERCYKYQLRSFAEWMADSRDVNDMEDVTTADLLAYRQSIQHLAASSQNRYLAAIKSFFAWALDTGLIEKNPAAGLKLPKAVSNRAPVFLTLDETRNLIATAKLPRDIALLWCLAYGLRIAEAQALQIGDVAQPNGNGLGALMVRGKGNKARTIPISSEAHETISTYTGGRTEGSLFLTLDGKRTISTRAIQARFKKLAIEAGIAPEKQHPHCMRHAFATRMLFDTKTIGGIYTVSKLLGHSRVAVTEMYLHCSQKQLEQAMLADPLGAGV
jgi:integrase/recombinase XerD